MVSVFSLVGSIEFVLMGSTCRLRQHFQTPQVARHLSRGLDYGLQSHSTKEGPVFQSARPDKKLPSKLPHAPNPSEVNSFFIDSTKIIRKNQPSVSRLIQDEVVYLRQRLLSQKFI